MIEQATQTATDQATNIYRQAVSDALDETRGGLPATSTSYSRLQAAQKALDKLTAQGITGYTDKAGRNWNLSSYVEMATRTAVSQRYDDLQTRALQAAGVDLVYTYTVSTEGTCPECLPWLGQVCLSLGGGTTGSVSVTGADGTTVTHDVAGTVEEARAAGFRHPSCFPGGVLVTIPSPARASFDHWYDGDLVIVHTASGVELPVTPNHPIATPEGWVAAGLLKVGQSVLRDGNGVERTMGAGPDDELVPARIGDVHEALRQSSQVPPVRVPASPEQFHGDGGGSDVEVIFADGLLVDDGHSEGGHLDADGQFVSGGEATGPLPGDSGIGQGFVAPDGAAHGVMGGTGESLTLCGRHRGQAAAHALALADGTPSVHQHLADLLPADVELPLDRGHGQSLVVETDRLVHPRAVVAALGAAAVDTPRFASVPELSVQLLLSRPIPGNDLVDLLPGPVTADRVVKVERRHFAGHVYNLQTADGWYTAAGIVVHNCRCEYVPYTDGTDFGLLTYAGNTPSQAADAYEAAQEQRGFERKVRAAANRAAVAVTPEAKAKAKADLKAAKAASKAHRESAGVVMTNVGVQRRERTGQAR